MLQVESFFSVAHLVNVRVKYTPLCWKCVGLGGYNMMKVPWEADQSNSLIPG